MGSYKSKAPARKKYKRPVTLEAETTYELGECLRYHLPTWYRDMPADKRVYIYLKLMDIAKSEIDRCVLELTSITRQIARDA